MDLQAFRELVERRFGPQLERATPEAIRSFVVTTREQLFPSKRDAGRYVLDETNTATDMERAGAAFLAESLRMPADTAAIGLWLHAAEVWYGLVETTYDARFADLMDDLDDETEDV